MHPRLRAPSIPPQPTWDPASWDPFVPALTAGDTSALDVQALLEAELLVRTFAGSTVPLPMLLDGIVLTHRISAAEIAGGFLELDPDLGLLYEFVRSGPPLASGGSIRQATVSETTQLGLPGDRIVVVGPTGWLGEFEAGDLGAVLVRRGALQLGTVTSRPTLHRSRARRLRRTFARLAAEVTDRGLRRPDGAAFTVTVRELVRELLIVEDERFRDTEPPLSEQLAAARLHTAHGWVAEPGTDLSACAPHPVCQIPLGDLIGDSGVDPEQISKLERAVFRHRVGMLDLEPGAMRALGATLCDPELLEVFWAWAADTPGLRAFLETLLGHMDGSEAAAVRVLLGRIAEADGDLSAHLAHVLATSDAFDCPEAVHEWAEIAAVRGHATLALRLLGHVGDTGSELAQGIARLGGVGDGSAVPLAQRAP